jgi:hypothetical protein
MDGGGLKKAVYSAYRRKAPISAGAPIFTIDQLWNGTANGYKWTVKFAHLRNTKVATTALSGTVDANGFQHLEAITTINLDYSSGEYWNSGDTTNNANTLIREFGHALRLFGFKGGQFEQNDDSYDVNRTNTDLITTNCLK